MYREISGDEVFPYILRGERDSELPTVWGLRPQKVRQGNRNFTGYMKAQGKHTDDAMAAAMTKQDLTRFLSCVAWVRNFWFKDEPAPRAVVEDEETLKRIFNGLDYNSMTELTTAAHDVFSLREGEKKELTSSSRAVSNGSTAAGSASTASDA
jgi:hypothetical protein